MRNININVINEERINQIERAFDGMKGIKYLKMEKNRDEETLISFLSTNKEYKDLYWKINQANDSYWSRLLDFIYEEAFRDALKFLMNSKA